jgi:hypothetical protein
MSHSSPEAGQSFNYHGINLTLKQQAQVRSRMYSFYKKMMFIWDQRSVGGLMNPQFNGRYILGALAHDYRLWEAQSGMPS